MTDETRSDAEVRAEDQARVDGDAVERRAISVGNVVRNRRAAPDANVPRAESRGVYRDADGRRRIVGAGQAIPDGWNRVESATVEDRIGGHDEPVAAAAEDGDATPKPRSRRK